MKKIRSNEIRLLLFVIVLAVVVMYVVTNTISRKTALDSAEDRAYSVARDSSAEQGRTLREALNGHFEVLRTLALAVSEFGGANEPGARISAMMKEISSDDCFSAVYLIDADGTATDSEGNVFTMSDRLFFIKSIEGEDAILKISDDRVLERYSFAISVPITRNGEIIGVVAGEIREDTLRETLVAEAFGKSGYSFITDSCGGIVVGNAESDRLATRNIENYLSKGVVDDGYSASSVMDMLRRRQSGHLSYEYDGENCYAVYLPADVNDWMIFTVIPGSAVNESINDAIKASDRILVLVYLSTFALVAAMYLVGKRERRRAVREREDLWMAAALSKRYIMRYDIKSDAVYRFYDPRASFGVDSAPDSYCKRVLLTKKLPEDSRKTYLSLFDRMRNGETTGGCSFLINVPGGNTVWLAVEYTLMLDSRGVPDHAVMSFYDDTENRTKELAYEKWRVQMNQLTRDECSYVEGNLTRDVVEDWRSYRSGDVFTVGDPLTEWMRKGIVTLVADADKASANEFFKRERLLGLFYSGVSEDQMEFRMMLGDGPEIWRRADVRMVKYPQSDEVNIFITFTDIDSEKREHERLAELAMKDPLTRLLNRTAVTISVEQSLEKALPGDKAAMFIIDVDNFKTLNDTAGHRRGDETLRDVATAISGVFRTTDVVGRLGGDEFIVFMCGNVTRAIVEQKARGICEAASFNVGEMTVTVSVGVAMAPCDEASFAGLYEVGDEALYRVKRSGKGRYSISDPDSGNVPRIDKNECDVGRYLAMGNVLDQLPGGVMILELDESPCCVYFSPSFRNLPGMPIAGGMGFGYDQLLMAMTDGERKRLIDAMYKAAGSDECVKCGFVVGTDGKTFTAMFRRIAHMSELPAVIGMITSDEPSN